jgi:hypothetical protein
MFLTTPSPPIDRIDGSPPKALAACSGLLAGIER